MYFSGSRKTLTEELKVLTLLPSNNMYLTWFIYIYILSYNVHLCEASRNISVICCNHPLSSYHLQPFHHNFFNFALFHGRVMVRINFHPSSCCHPSSSFLMISAGVRSNSLAIKRCLGVTRDSRQGRAHDDPHAGHKIRVGSLQHGDFLGEKQLKLKIWNLHFL